MILRHSLVFFVLAFSTLFYQTAQSIKETPWDEAVLSLTGYFLLQGVRGDTFMDIDTLITLQRLS